MQLRRPLRIVHVVGSAYAGDWAFYPLKMLVDAGHAVTLVCPSDGPLPQRANRHGIPVLISPFPRRLRNVSEAGSYVAHLSSFLRRERVDVVHNHLIPSNIWGRLSAWIARVPVRLTQWPGPLPLEIPMSRRAELATVWMDNGIIAACEATKKIFERYWHTRRKVVLSYYGFPFDRFEGDIDGGCVRREFAISDEDLVVSLIAYMYSPVRERQLPGLAYFSGVGLKGHEILIESAAQVNEVMPNVRFLIVGDSLVPGEAERYKESLRKRVSDLGLEGTVTFTGKRKDVAQIIAASDVVAVPSLSENVGGAVEPLLMGKPVVASDVGGLPDVVIEGQTGFLAPPGDSTALSSAIVRALTLPRAERASMGGRGSEMVRKMFDLHRTVPEIESIYYRLLD